MPVISATDLFYESRQSTSVSRTNPANNKHNNLSTVPQAACISFGNGTQREVSPDNQGKDVSRFLISRAMIDPDATVEPIQ